MPLYHAFLTRFAVKLREGAPLPSVEWLQRRFALFEAFCLPSMRMQSELGFEWLLFYDAGLASTWQDRLRGYAAEWPAVVPVPIDTPWNHFTAHDAVRSRVPQECRWVLTSRLDNDDAVAVDYNARLRAHARRLARGAVVFDWGFNLAGQAVYVQPLLRGPFASTISEVGGEKRMLTVWDHEHEQLDQVMPVVHLGRPCAWIQVVHGDNLANRQRGVRVPRRALLRRFPLPALAADQRESTATLALGVASSGARFGWSVLSDGARAKRMLSYVRRRAYRVAQRVLSRR